MKIDNLREGNRVGALPSIAHVDVRLARPRSRFSKTGANSRGGYNRVHRVYFLEARRGSKCCDDKKPIRTKTMESFSSSPVTLEKTQGLSERVYRAILQMLARGSLRRGSTLRIDILAKGLDVSPTPVREALARLAATGLVLHESRKGYTVAPPISARQLSELMDARRLIEIGAIGFACHEGGEAFRDALAKALRRQRAAVEAFHAAGEANSERETLAWNVMESDLQFHQVIFDHSGNRFIRVMADALCGQLHRVRQSAERGISDDMEALAEHQTILDAVLTGVRDAAEGAMRAHIDNVEKRSSADLGSDSPESGGTGNRSLARIG
jgi:DNA-binding GntR family transcriptional regulator